MRKPPTLSGRGRVLTSSSGFPVATLRPRGGGGDDAPCVGPALWRSLLPGTGGRLSDRMNGLQRAPHGFARKTGTGRSSWLFPFRSGDGRPRPFRAGG